MSRQYQIPGGPYVNLPEDGREYQLPGSAYLNQAAAVTTTVKFRRTLSALGTRMGSRQTHGAI